MNWNDRVKRELEDKILWTGDMNGSIIEWMDLYTARDTFNDMFARRADQIGVSKEVLFRDLDFYIRSGL